MFKEMIEKLAQRFWSIRPKELDDIIISPHKGFYGGARAMFYADEITKLAGSIAYEGAKEAVIAWEVCVSTYELNGKKDPFYSTKLSDYKKARDAARMHLEEIIKMKDLHQCPPKKEDS